MKKGNIPVHQLSLPLGGRMLKAAVWRVETDDGDMGFTITYHLGRSSGAGEVEFSESLDANHLEGLVSLAEAATEWIVKEGFAGLQPNETVKLT